MQSLIQGRLGDRGAKRTDLGLGAMSEAELAELRHAIEVLRSKHGETKTRQDYLEKQLLSLQTQHQIAERDIYNAIQGLRKELTDIPDKVSTNMSKCKGDIEAHAREVYAKKTEVITKTFFLNTMMAGSLVLGTVLGGTVYLLDRISANEHQTVLNAHGYREESP